MPNQIEICNKYKNILYVLEREMSKTFFSFLKAFIESSMNI